MALVDIRVLSGERVNRLETGTVSLLIGSADPLFPITNLYDGRPSRSFRTTSATTSIQILVDGNSVVNGSLDSWSGGAPSGWTVESGTVTQTVVAGEFVNGSAAKFNPGLISQNFTVRSGEKRTISSQLRGDGVAGIAMTLQNLTTGSQLQNNGTWSSGGGSVMSRVPNTYAAASVNYTVEPFSTTQADTCTMRLVIAAAALGYADDIYDYPAADFVSVHGHNLDASVLARFYSATDSLFPIATLQATIAIVQPSFYALLAAPVYARYFTFYLTYLVGANSVIPEIGELVIGQTYALTVPPEYGAEIGYMRDDVATDTGVGELAVYARSAQTRRTLGLKFHFETETRMRAARDEVFRRSGGRLNPIVVIPDTTLPDVIFGRLDRTWKVTRTLTTYYDQNDLQISELPFPVPTN